MPARTLNDFFSGFFYGRTKEDFEVDTAISLENENGRKRSNRRQSHRTKTNMEPIKIGGEVDKGQDVTIHGRTAPQRKEKSTFSWFEEFTVEWSETSILKKQKETTRRENK